MASALPLILAAGAAAVLLGGKKKKKPYKPGEPVVVKKDGVVVHSADSPVPEAVAEDPLEPFENVIQVQEALIVSGYSLPKYGADGDWGGESLAAMEKFIIDNRLNNSPPDITPKVLRRLHGKAYEATQAGKMEDPRTSAGTNLWCNIIELDCPKGYECVPIFGPGDAPRGYKDLGICISRSLLSMDVVPGPQDYAPGGFDKVYFAPDYSFVEIGNGWRFRYLEPWLYERMKAGNLLTFTQNRTLDWEDAILEEPKKFWNATLAKVGLATAAGGVGTKGWLSFRKAFRDEIPIRELVHRTEHGVVNTWRGPEGFAPSSYADNPFLTRWPPPDDIVQKWAGYRVVERDSAKGFAHLMEPDGIHRGKLQPYGYVDEVHFGSPKSIRVKLIPNAPGLAGMEVFDVIGAYGSRTINARNLDEAIAIAIKEPAGVRAERMIALWGDTQQVTETVTDVVDTGRVKISWRNPNMRQFVKGVGVPMAVGAVIAGTVYGGSRLVRRLADKQRDLIAESAILAWKDFAKSHVVRVGNRKVKIEHLPEVVAVQFFQAYVAKAILKFQKSTYE